MRSLGPWGTVRIFICPGLTVALTGRLPKAVRVAPVPKARWPPRAPSAPRPESSGLRARGGRGEMDQSQPKGPDGLWGSSRIDKDRL